MTPTSTRSAPTRVSAGIISNSAYRLLHLVIPELGPPKRSIDFKGNRAAEIKILEDWWAENGGGNAI